MSSRGKEEERDGNGRGEGEESDDGTFGLFDSSTPSNVLEDGIDDRGVSSWEGFLYLQKEVQTERRLKGRSRTSEDNANWFECTFAHETHLQPHQSTRFKRLKARWREEREGSEKGEGETRDLRVASNDDFPVPFLKRSVLRPHRTIAPHIGWVGQRERRSRERFEWKRD